MTGRLRAFGRLFGVQADWNYARMLGAGMGYAAAPLLGALRDRDPARYPEAVARSADFFNCNPNLAGLALGALVRAESEGVPGPQVSRLRTALCGPLGALGDRLFWAGLVPFLSGLTVVAVALGGGLVAVLVMLLCYNAIRAASGWWALRTGLREGMQVGRAIGESWLPGAAERVGPPAGFAVGLAIPVAAAWLRGPRAGALVPIAIGIALAGIALAVFVTGRATAIRLTLALLVLTQLIGRVIP